MTKEDEIVHVDAEQCYARLIVELADAFGVDATALQETGHLIAHGVDVGLLSYKVWDQGRITIFFDLGSIPAVRQADTWRKLLEQNLLLPRLCGAYAIIPGTDHGALAYTFDVSDGLDGYALAKNICETLTQYKSMEKSRPEVGSPQG